MPFLADYAHFLYWKTPQYLNIIYYMKISKLNLYKNKLGITAIIKQHFCQDNRLSKTLLEYLGILDKWSINRNKQNVSGEYFIYPVRDSNNCNYIAWRVKFPYSY